MDRRRGRARAVLVRQSALGTFDDAGPRPELVVPRALRLGRALLLPLSSLMRVDTRDQVLALTFDDGPHPEHTGAVLDVLAEHGVRATFFVLAERAEQYPEVIQRMIADGHEVGLHGIDHARLTDLPAREGYRRLAEGQRRLERVTRRPVTLFRPTYGAIGMFPQLGARRLGMDVVIWTAWARDWIDAPAGEVADRVVATAHPGAIVLLHDTIDPGDAAAMQAPPRFDRGEVTRLALAGLDRAGFRVVPMPELLRRYPMVRALTAHRPGRRNR